MNDKILKNEEKAVFDLRCLYSKYGYLPYKMSKFEEYDLYVKNKDFLSSGGVITFNDDGGKLLALKPDVTLSILKNGAKDKQNQKVYYNETVYRKSSDGNFHEIMQVGVENIGSLTKYDIFETVLLAVKSLDEIGGNFVLELSHLGLIGAMLENTSEDFKSQVVSAVSAKSEHTINKLCDEFGYDELARPLRALVSLCGDEAIEKAKTLFNSEKYASAVNELIDLYDMLKRFGYGDKVSVDFSLTGNMKYYNGIVFSGYIEGKSEKILSGGQYDLLARKIRHDDSGAIGFAVYTDLLAKRNEGVVDFEVAVIYDDSTDQVELVKTISALVGQGKRVSAFTANQVRGRFIEKIDLTGGIR